jgi:hypothetical protein
MQIRSCVGTWACLANIWHPLHCLTSSSVSFKTIGQKNPVRKVLPTSVLEVAWLPQQPKWILSKISFPFSLETHLRSTPDDAALLYRLSPTRT